MSKSRISLKNYKKTQKLLNVILNFPTILYFDLKIYAPTHRFQNVVFCFIFNI